MNGKNGGVCWRGDWSVGAFFFFLFLGWIQIRWIAQQVKCASSKLCKVFWLKLLKMALYFIVLSVEIDSIPPGQLSECVAYELTLYGKRSYYVFYLQQCLRLSIRHPRYKERRSSI